MIRRLKVSLLVAGLDENFVIKTNTSASMYIVLGYLRNPPLNPIHEKMKRNLTYAHEVNDL